MFLNEPQCFYDERQCHGMILQLARTPAR